MIMRDWVPLFPRRELPPPLSDGSHVRVPMSDETTTLADEQAEFDRNCEAFLRARLDRAGRDRMITIDMSDIEPCDHYEHLDQIADLRAEVERLRANGPAEPVTDFTGGQDVTR